MNSIHLWSILCATYLPHFHCVVRNISVMFQVMRWHYELELCVADQRWSQRWVSAGVREVSEQSMISQLTVVPDCHRHWPTSEIWWCPAYADISGQMWAHLPTNKIFGLFIKYRSTDDYMRPSSGIPSVHAHRFLAPQELFCTWPPQQYRLCSKCFLKRSVLRECNYRSVLFREMSKVPILSTSLDTNLSEQIDRLHGSTWCT